MSTHPHGAVTPRLAMKLRETLGPEGGDDLVALFQTLVSQGELLRSELHATLRADFAEFRHEMRIEMKTEINALETRLTEKLHTVEKDLSAKIGDVNVKLGDVKSDLMKWSFVFWVGAVGAIAALAGVLR